MTITQSILVATDFSSGARAGLEKAAELARAVGAKVTVCHVLDPSPLAPIASLGAAAARLRQGQDIEKAIHEALAATVAEFFADIEPEPSTAYRDEGPRASNVRTALIISTSAPQGICHYAEKEDTDLIVVSTHGRTGLAHLLIGSVAENVVRHAPCPVLTVRSLLE